MYEMWLKIRSFVFPSQCHSDSCIKTCKSKKKEICFILPITDIDIGPGNSTNLRQWYSCVLDCDSTTIGDYKVSWLFTLLKLADCLHFQSQLIVLFVYIPPSAMLLCAWLWLYYYWWWLPKWIWPHRARSLPDPASHDRSRRRWSCRSARFCAQSRNGTVAVKGKKKEFKMHEHPLKPVFGAIWTTCAIASAQCGEVSIECNLNFPTIYCTLYFSEVNMYVAGSFKFQTAGVRTEQKTLHGWSYI